MFTIEAGNQTMARREFKVCLAAFRFWLRIINDRVDSISNGCWIDCCNLRMFWFFCWTCAPITASVSASMEVQFYCNCEKIRCEWGLQSTAARFHIGSWSISTRIYSRILVPLFHLHTNAKHKIITAINCCFSTRNRSSKPVSAQKSLTTAANEFKYNT